MALNTQYWGPTIFQVGGTYLNSKAILSIEEGYAIGVSTEYVKVGDFEIDNFSNTGALRQTLELSASEPLKRLNSNNSYFSRNFSNHYKNFDDFQDSNKFNEQWGSDVGTWGISSGFAQIVTNNSGDDWLALNDRADISDVRVIAKGQIASYTGYLEIGLRRSDANNFYRLLFFENQGFLQKAVDGVYTTLGT